MDLSKRRLFKRSVAPLRTALPWQIEEQAFINACTRCSACAEVCETQIIVMGDGGFPSIAFNLGECTFCYECALACPENLFQKPIQTPWDQVAHFSDDCLANKRVECRTCGDACDEVAIGFKLQFGGVASPQLDEELCTGCGACVAICPTQAIKIKSKSRNNRAEK